MTDPKTSSKQKRQLGIGFYLPMLSTLAQGFDKYGVGSACNCVPGMQVHVRHSGTFFCLAFPLPVSQGHE